VATLAEARAKLKPQIEQALDIGLPRAYAPEPYQQKCEAVFAPIEKAYPERDLSVHSLAQNCARTVKA